MVRRSRWRRQPSNPEPELEQTVAADEPHVGQLVTAVLAAAAVGDNDGLRILLADVPRGLLVDFIEYMACLAVAGWSAACGENREAVVSQIRECVLEAASE